MTKRYPEKSKKEAPVVVVHDLVHLEEDIKFIMGSELHRLKQRILTQPEIGLNSAQMKAVETYAKIIVNLRREDRESAKLLDTQDMNDEDLKKEVFQLLLSDKKFREEAVKFLEEKSEE